MRERERDADGKETYCWIVRKLVSTAHTYTQRVRLQITDVVTQHAIAYNIVISLS